MKTTDYFDKHKIGWFPLGISLKNGLKVPLYDADLGLTPTMNDFKNFSKKEIKKRHHFSPKYKYGAVDTSIFQHIDVDIEESTEYPAETMAFIGEQMTKRPYFESIGKGKPHFIIKNTNKFLSKRCKTIYREPEDQEKACIEILSGQWSYFKLDGFIYNSELEVTPLDEKYINHSEIKSKKPLKSSNSKTTNPLVLNNLKKEMSSPTVEEIEILKNINIRFWDNYDSWRCLMWALYNKYNDLDICDEYSKLSKNYQGFETVKKIVADDKKNLLAFGTIAYYSKISNEGEYLNIKGRYSKILQSNSDYDMALQYLNLVGDNIVKEDDQLYIYQDPFWKCDNLLVSIRKNMRDTLFQQYISKLNYLRTQEKELGEDNTHKIKLVTSSINCINTSAKQKSIVEQISVILENGDYQFDLNRPELICFQNITFNLDTRQKAIVNKYDYITLNTGYNYRPPNNLELEKINKFLVDILPNKNVRDCAISVLRRALYGKQDEYFVLFNGEGGNGKGIICELFKEVCGNDDYYYDGNDSVLVNKIKTGANPEIANSNLKRCIVYSEPDEGEKLNTSTIKYFTGNPIINARGLYSSKTKIHLHSTTILQCNQRPKMSGRGDNAMLRRLIDILFPVNFVNSVDDLIEGNPFVKLKDVSFKEKEFKDNHKYALFDIIFNSEHNEIYIPREVQARGTQFLFDNDDLLNWFNEYYELSESKDDIIQLKDLYEEFKGSSTYTDFTKDCRRNEWSKSKFMEKIQTSIALKRYYKDRVKIKGLTCRSVLINHKKKTTNESMFDDIDDD